MLLNLLGTASGTWSIVTNTTPDAAPDSFATNSIIAYSRPRTFASVPASLPRPTARHGRL